MSSIFGVTVFLVLLMFAAHVTLNLWLISAVDSVAHDAATDVATSGAHDDELAEVEAEAIVNARAALGGYGRRVDFVFEPDGSGRAVVLHVTSPELRLLPRLAGDITGIGGLDRRITVAREEVEQ